VRANVSRPLVLGYLAVGFLLADLHSYLEQLSVVRGIVSALLAICFWPLLLLGIDLHVRQLG
jgi:hypothetical protein